MIQTSTKTRIASQFTLILQDGRPVTVKEIVTELHFTNAQGFSTQKPQITGRRYETASGQPINLTDDGGYELVATGERLTRS